MNNQDVYLSEAIDVIEEILNGGGEFQMYPRGISMLPLIVQERDSVVLKKRSGPPARKWDIAFYRRENGQFVLHRVMKVCQDGTYVMCGDNQISFEKNVLPEQIIGYVDQLYRKGKKVSFRSLRYKVYVFFWTFMPYRCAIKGFKKILRLIKKKLFGHNEG